MVAEAFEALKVPRKRIRYDEALRNGEEWRDQKDFNFGGGAKTPETYLYRKMLPHCPHGRRHRWIGAGEGPHRGSGVDTALISAWICESSVHQSAARG